MASGAAQVPQYSETMQELIDQSVHSEDNADIGISSSMLLPDIPLSALQGLTGFDMNAITFDAPFSRPFALVDVPNSVYLSELQIAELAISSSCGCMCLFWIAVH